MAHALLLDNMSEQKARTSLVRCTSSLLNPMLRATVGRR